MGLENFRSSSGSEDSSDSSDPYGAAIELGDDGEDLSSLGSGISSTRTTAARKISSSQWNPKINFGSSFILVVEDRQDNIYKKQGHSSIVDENDSWKRLELLPNGDPDEDWSQVEKDLEAEYRVLFERTTEQGWLKFCNLVQDQLDTHPQDVLEDDPVELHYLEDQVHYPPGSKPDKSRTCQVCGKSSDEDSIRVLEVDLHQNRQTPVCIEHTVAELAEEGLLQ